MPKITFNDNFNSVFFQKSFVTALSCVLHAVQLDLAGESNIHSLRAHLPSIPRFETMHDTSITKYIQKILH